MTEIEQIIRNANSKQGKENRANGEQFEFRVLRRFKRRSDVLYAIRSAGSHGLFDIIVQFKDGKMFLITCKRNGYLAPKEQKQLDKARQYILPHQSIKLAYYPSCKKMVVTNL